MQYPKRSQMRGSLFLHRPSSNLFGVPSKGDIGPQEIESASSSIIDEREIDSPNEDVRRSSLAGEGTPATICPRILEDNFMLDSLNEQRNYPSHPPTDSKAQARGKEKIKEEKENEGFELPPEKSTGENLFMSALQTAISHFEKESTFPKERKPETKKIMYRHKHSPTSSYNSSNTTAANSMGERHDDMVEHESLKRQYNALLAKYNDLKSSNKQLMNDYAVLRSQFEEIKAMKQVYEKEIQQLRQQVYDAELRLTHTTELYTKEKIEKESNALAFKRILETYSRYEQFNRMSYGGMQKMHPTASVLGTTYAPHLEMDPEENFMGREEEGVTLEYVQRLEDEIAVKDKEIKLIKEKLVRDPKKCSPDSQTKRSAAKHAQKSPPQANLVRGSIQNPGLKNFAISRSPTEASKPAMQKHVPYCVSTKGNIQLPGKSAISPKISGQAFHKFRSPSYTEQQNAALLRPRPQKKGTEKILPKQ